MKLLKLKAVIVIMTAFFNVMSAQELRGIVISENDLPVSNVSISVQNQLIVKTDETGAFFLPKQFSFPLQILIDHPDYESLTAIFSENNQQFILRETIQTESLNTVLLNAQNATKEPIIIPIVTVGIAQINRQSPVDVVSSINQTPGIYIQSGAINTNRIIIRGVGSRTLYGTNKIRGYFNEIPITSGVGETAIDIYDPEDLESINIIKGPKATQYGTNLGGTILLRSKKPVRAGFAFRNNSTIGSFGLFKNSLSLDYANPIFNLHVTYDHLELDGFRDNSHYNRNAFFLNSSYRVSKNTQISLLMNYVDYTAQISSSIGKTAFEENPSQAAFTWTQAKGFENDKQNLTGLSLKHQITENFENTTSIFYSYSDHYEPRPFNILDEYTQGFGGRTVFNKAFKLFNRNAEWTFGGELFKDEYHWKTIENLYADNNGNGSLEGVMLSNNEEYRQQWNVFSMVTLPVLEKVTLQAGINLNKTIYDFQDEFNTGATNRSVSRNFDAILAPNLNVVYQFANNQNLFANISYGFNYPSLEEALTPEGVVNPDITPEKGFNYEMGSESYFFKRKWHVLASVYILDIRDLLVAQRVDEDQYIGRNAGQTLHKGIELSTDYKWVMNESWILSPYIHASFNWHRFKDFVSDDTDFSGNELTGVPDMTFASGIALQYKNLSFYGNHLYVGDMPMNDANSLYSDAYNTFNLKLTYETLLFKDLDLRMNVGVNNVFDTHYASAILINATGFGSSEPRYYYPGNPRNYYGGISVRYRL